eukprot:scaffold273837_cov27-Tisochrysis_lutea.AAC.3
MRWPDTLITSSTRPVEAAVDGEVGRDIAIVVAEHIANRRRPGGLDCEEAFARTLLFDALLIDDGRTDAEEWPHRRARLHVGARNGQRHDHDATCLRLPPRVDDWAALLANDLIVPAPRLRIDGLTNRTEELQRFARGAFKGRSPQAHERTDGGGRCVKLGDVVLVDNAP